MTSRGEQNEAKALEGFFTKLRVHTVDTNNFIMHLNLKFFTAPLLTVVIRVIVTHFLAPLIRKVQIEDSIFV